MRAEPLIDLDHLRIKQLGQNDVPIEQPRPILIGDAQCIAKAARHNQNCRLALALEQRIGRNGRPHFDGLNQIDRHRRVCGNAQQAPNAGDRRVVVLFRVIGQQLVRHQRAVGLTRDDIGERAAAVDPELPRRLDRRLLIDCGRQ